MSNVNLLNFCRFFNVIPGCIDLTFVCMTKHHLSATKSTDFLIQQIFSVKSFVYSWYHPTAVYKVLILIVQHLKYCYIAP